MSRAKKPPSGRHVSTVPCPSLGLVRRSKTLTAPQLVAQLPGVSLARLEGWEKRRRAPRAELERIARVLEVDVEQLQAVPEDGAVAALAEVDRIEKELRASVTAACDTFRRFLSGRT
jgi:DNA-binding transcriptional regulator YiaG